MPSNKYIPNELPLARDTAPPITMTSRRAQWFGLTNPQIAPIFADQDQENPR
jgi:hypothetical protein